MSIFDSSSLKRLGLEYLNVNIEKSFETFDPITNNHTIVIYLSNPNKLICSKCGSLTRYKVVGTRTRIIRWSTNIEKNIKIIWHKRIFKCLSCSKTFEEPNVFTCKKQSISISKKDEILEKLKCSTETYLSVANKFKVSDTFVGKLFDKNTNTPRLKLTKVICLDEVYAKRLSFHKYCFIIYSPFTGKIIDVLDSRRKNRLDEYFQTIPWQERKLVQYVSIDLYEIYRTTSRKFFPLALICADPFHVIKNLYECFNNLRSRFAKRIYETRRFDDYRFKLYKKYWRFLNKPRNHLSDKEWYSKILCRRTSSKEIVKLILSLDDELKQGYELVHEYREFNETKSRKEAELKFSTVCWHFFLSPIPEMKKFHSLLVNWVNEILNSFTFIDGRRVTNGPMERANRDIKQMFYLSFGMRNFERTRKRIMYVINNKNYKLDK